MRNFIRTDDAVRYMIELSKELTGSNGSTGCVLYIEGRAMRELMRRAREGSPPPYIITEELVKSLKITRKDYELYSDGIDTIKMPDKMQD